MNKNLPRHPDWTDFTFFDDELETKYETSSFGEDEYRCYGACYCVDDFRRSTLSVSRGMFYLLTSLTSVAAAYQAKSYFDQQCQEEYSTRCPFNSIESEVDDCEIIDPEMEVLEESVVDNFHGIRKFFCQGFCVGGNDNESREKCVKLRAKQIMTVGPGEDSLEALSLFKGTIMERFCEQGGCVSSSKTITCESTFNGEIQKRRKAEKHSDGSIFYNPRSWNLQKSKKSVKEMVRWVWSKAKDKEVFPTYEDLPILKPKIIPNSALKKDVAVTWIGHSSFLVQVKDGITFVTDPVFSKRASMTQYAGPKRIRDPPIDIADLPVKVDLVVISHNHYDHMDYQSAIDLAEHSDPIFFVPLQNKRWFIKNGVTGEDRVVELDWYEYFEFEKNGKKMRINLVPAQHWSRRGTRDFCKSLWGGFVLEFEVDGVMRKAYFVGDSGYNPVLFKEIGEEYGPIDLGFVPIGAYHPKEAMELSHMDPEEAVKLSKDSKIKKSFAMHHATFKLSEEPIAEPNEFLEEVLEEEELEEGAFESLDHGETFFFDFQEDEDEWK